MGCSRTAAWLKHAESIQAHPRTQATGCRVMQAARTPHTPPPPPPHTLAISCASAMHSTSFCARFNTAKGLSARGEDVPILSPPPTPPPSHMEEKEHHPTWRTIRRTGKEVGCGPFGSLRREVCVCVGERVALRVQADEADVCSTHPGHLQLACHHAAQHCQEHHDHRGNHNGHHTLLVGCGVGGGGGRKGQAQGVSRNGWYGAGPRDIPTLDDPVPHSPCPRHANVHSHGTEAHQPRPCTALKESWEGIDKNAQRRLEHPGQCQPPRMSTITVTAALAIAAAVAIQTIVSVRRGRAEVKFVPKQLKVGHLYMAACGCLRLPARFPSHIHASVSQTCQCTTTQ
jgi:hypothetical protein